MKRRQSSIKVIGQCWEYSGKEFYDPDYGTYIQFGVNVKCRASMGIIKRSSMIFVHWFGFENRYPKKGDWLECTGQFGGARIKERLDKPPQANLVLMCWGDDVKNLGKEEAP